MHTSPLSNWSRSATVFACAMASAFTHFPFAGDGPFAFLVEWALAAVIAHWVITDARERRRNAPYDLDSFFFYTWTLSAPIYLFITRKWRAFLPLASFVTLYSAGWFCGAFLDEIAATTRL